MGTAPYMAPEQVRGEPVDYRADIFSFGAVLYEMLCGKRAFAGDTSVEIMTAILKSEPAEYRSAARRRFRPRWIASCVTVWRRILPIAFSRCAI